MLIPDGVAGTRATLRKMSHIVREYRSDYPVIELSRYLVANLQQKDFFGEAALIQQFVRDQIRYVKDPRGVETIQTPVKTLEIGQGDCDDKSILVATMLETLGHRCLFVAVGFDKNFCHVLVKCFLNNEWVAVETTEPVEIGWYPKNVTNEMIEYI